jgi:sec-independent protein translocase protein TatA
MGELSITHWLIILVVLLVLFGPARLPQLGSSLGAAIRDFKKSLKDESSPEQKKVEAQLPESDANKKNVSS